MSTPDKYWFPAKRYGWGWGLPSSWQGWIVLAAYFAAMALVYYYYPPPAHLFAFLIGTAWLTVLLVAVCWLKGEPPRWRWGKE